MPPLKKGDVRKALDKRIEAARKAQAKVKDGTDIEEVKQFAAEKGKEQVLQNVRKELFGERLGKG